MLWGLGMEGATPSTRWELEFWAVPLGFPFHGPWRGAGPPLCHSCPIKPFPAVLRGTAALGGIKECHRVAKVLDVILTLIPGTNPGSAEGSSVAL